MGGPQGPHEERQPPARSSMGFLSLLPAAPGGNACGSPITISSDTDQLLAGVAEFVSSRSSWPSKQAAPYDLCFLNLTEYNLRLQYGKALRYNRCALLLRFWQNEAKQLSRRATRLWLHRP
jgi:hypothetical protein